MVRRGIVLLGCVVVLASVGGVAGSAAGSPVRGAAAAGDFSVSLSATPSFGSAPLAVVFQSTVSSGTPTYYAWTFGDGSTLNGTNASFADPEHIFATAGTFTTDLNVSEGAQYAVGTIVLHVVAAPLLVSVSATPSTGVEPLTVTFRANVTGGTGTFLSVNWSFGDGSTGSGFVVQYTYQRAGDFYVTVRAEDSAHTTAAAYAWVNLTSPAADGPSVGFGPIEAWAALGFALGVVATALVVVLRVRRRSTEPLGDEPGGTTGIPDGPAVASAGPVPAVTPPAEATVPPSAPPTGPVLRLSQRIVVHLAGQGPLGAYDVAPPGRTQSGMATTLHVRQNALTNVLRRLVAAGVVEEDLRHVVGQPRRLKVYRLTPRGELLARELRHRPPAP